MVEKKDWEDKRSVKTERLARAVSILALSTVLMLLGVVAMVSLAQSPLNQAPQVAHSLAPDTLSIGESALGTLVVHNHESRGVTLDSLQVQLAQGLGYVGQAVDSDVAAPAQVDGKILSWTGPFDLAADETLTLRYWLVATDAIPGERRVQAVISLGGQTTNAAEASLEIRPAAAATAGGTSPTSNLLAKPAANGDVAASKTVEPTMTEPGSQVAYTVVFTNNTPSDVVLDAITDVLPVSFQYVGLAVGSEVSVEPIDTDEPEIAWQGAFTVPATGTLMLRYWVWVLGEAVPSDTPYTNTVAAVYSGTIVGPVNAAVTVIGPNVQVSKEVRPSEVIVAQPVTYTVVLENQGNGQGIVEMISDTLPAGFLFLDMLPGGTITAAPAGVTGTIAWAGPFTLPVGSVMTMTYQARASLASGSENATNQVVAQVDGALTEVAKATVHVEPFYSFLPLILRNWIAPYFKVTKVASAAQVNQGEDVIYTVTFVNGGTDDGVLDKISDMLPAGFTFKSMETGGDVLFAPAGTTGTILWSGPFTVGSGESLTLIYRVQASDVPGTYVNSATATTLVGFAPEEPASATVQVKEPILLSEDFESGTDGWEPFLNYWRLSPEQWYLEGAAGYGNSTGLRHTYWLGASEPARGAHDALYMYRGAGSEQWTDYRVEAWVRMDDGSNMGLWVRGKYIPSTVEGLHVEGYYVAWRPNRSVSSITLSRLRSTGGTAYHFSDPEALVSANYLMKKNTWYRMAVEVRGDNIKVFIDGNLLIDHNDSTYSEGTVGFFCYKLAYGTWDDILVTPLD
jgi:uncharacterized repeat protein (TIGR01451 family)